MKNTAILLFLLLLISMTFSAVSAQDIDINSMDSAQLTALLQQILIKLQQEEDPAAVLPVNIPFAPEEPQKPAITVWLNKKLMIEALPDYMFIQKAPDKDDESNGSSTSGGSSIKEKDTEKICYDKCKGYNEIYGTWMVDMECYAKCLGDI